MNVSEYTKKRYQLYEKRTWPMEIIVLYGSNDSKLNKSINDLLNGVKNGNNVYVKNPKFKSWDNYDGEENVLIENFNYIKFDGLFISQLMGDSLLYVYDKKRKRLMFRSKRLFITTKINPNSWYEKDHYLHLYIIKLLKDYAFCYDVDDDKEIEFDDPFKNQH